VIDPSNVPAVGPDETLARYVLHSKYVRSDHTVTQNAFIPHPWPDLSVTRHLRATEDEIWTVGESVATQLNKTLYGRADFVAVVCLSKNLAVNPDPIPENPNHANISAWPTEKHTQKIIALEIAATASFVANPRLR
jgi:hypothetical protein